MLAVVILMVVVNVAENREFRARRFGLRRGDRLGRR